MDGGGVEFNPHFICTLFIIEDYFSMLLSTKYLASLFVNLWQQLTDEYIESLSFSYLRAIMSCPAWSFFTLLMKKKKTRESLVFSPVSKDLVYCYKRYLLEFLWHQVYLICFCLKRLWLVQKHLFMFPLGWTVVTSSSSRIIIRSTFECVQFFCVWPNTYRTDDIHNNLSCVYCRLVNENWGRTVSSPGVFMFYLLWTCSVINTDLVGTSGPHRDQRPVVM